MYEYIFSTKVETFIWGMIIATITIFILTKGKSSISEAVRMLLYSYSSIFALGFLTAVFYSSISINKLDVLSSWLFEYIVFIMQLIVFMALRKTVANNQIVSKKGRRTVTIILFAILLVNLNMLMMSGGIDGERLSYLSESPFNKYTTYFSVLFIAFLAAVSAGEVNYYRKISLFVIFIIFSVFLYSLMTESKGVFFLFALQVVSMVNLQRYRISSSRLLGVGIFSIILLSVSVSYISRKIGINPGHFLELAFYRFYINNDARALAFDYRSYASSHDVSTFLIHSFRSLSSVIGYTPFDPPLGNLLFKYLYGTVSTNGANASLIALATYYSSPGENIINIGSVLMIFTPMIFIAYYIISLEVNPTLKALYYSFLLVVLILFSQDFLSFQLVFILFIFVLVTTSLLMILNKKP
ncbi:hypothetical protein [Yokenella regensburgei]|uniref:hypothetical protein n=1 Tax=Yokenella regensburgei TaxID=158877 RepID=UPI003ED8627A